MSEKGNFEESIEKLEEIANELEKGELNLDDAVSKFEEGMKLSQKCAQILSEAEKKISILIESGNDVTEENFDTNE